MDVQHTPGPWSWDAGIIPPDGPGRYADIYVMDEDREPITLAEFNDSLPEGRANARLIAAAPELLGVLITLRNADDMAQREGWSGCMGDAQRSQVDAAIARATSAA